MNWIARDPESNGTAKAATFVGDFRHSSPDPQRGVEGSSIRATINTVPKDQLHLFLLQEAYQLR